MRRPSPATVSMPVPPSRPSSIHGMAALARALIAGEPGQALWAELAARRQADPSDADALFDLAMMLRLNGKVEESTSASSRRRSASGAASPAMARTRA